MDKIQQTKLKIRNKHTENAKNERNVLLLNKSDVFSFYGDYNGKNKINICSQTSSNHSVAILKTFNANKHNYSNILFKNQHTIECFYIFLKNKF